MEGIFQKILENTSQSELHCYEIKSEELESLCFQLKHRFNYIWFIDLKVTDIDSSSFEIEYFFNVIELKKFFSLKFTSFKNETVKSIAQFWINSIDLEQEAFEMFGVSFSRPYENRLFDSASVKPMLKGVTNFEEIHAKKLSDPSELYSLPHSGVELDFFELRTFDNVVDRCNIVRGQSYLGLEKSLEGKSTTGFQDTIEQYFSFKSTNLSFLSFYNAETANKVDVPERAKVLRMVILELQRILDHLFFLRSIAMVIKNESLNYHILTWIKKFQSLSLSYVGGEYLHSFFCMGGVRKDATQSWISRTMAEIIEAKDLIKKQIETLRRDKRFFDVLNIPLILKRDGEQRCLTGPVVRSVGLNLDLRKTNPFYFYDHLKFDVPVASGGRVFDIVMVRFEEIFQSMSMINQLLDNLPTGKIINGDFLLPSLNIKDKGMSVDDYSKEIQQYYTMPDHNMSFFIEGANGIVGLSSYHQGNGYERVKIISNDLFLTSFFEDKVKGVSVDKLPLVWLSLGIDMKMVEK